MAIESLLLGKDHFFCFSCLQDKPTSTQSLDHRYCRGCCEFLLKEVEMLTGGRRPGWIPKAERGDSTGTNSSQKSMQVPHDVAGIMSTVADDKSRVDIINPVVGKFTIGKRGPKHKELPLELIGRLAGSGMGSKAIATELRSKQRISISYKTIQRVLSGERQNIATPVEVW